VDIAERFGATIRVQGPDDEAEGTFFVKHRDDVDHTQFMVRLLGVVGDADRLVMHHRSGFAVVVVPYGLAKRLSALPWVETVGGVQFDPEQFAAVTGMQLPS
jgi:hypothetical protein